MKAKTEVIGTPTANGIVKGRPGKGRVLSLEQRKNCYAGHRMTEENTFRYTAKRVKGKAKPIERAWCRKCRAISRKSSASARRLREAKEAKAAKRETNAAISKATTRKGKGSKAAKVKGSKAAKVSPAKAGKVAKPGKATAAKVKVTSTKAKAA